MELRGVSGLGFDNEKTKEKLRVLRISGVGVSEGFMGWLLVVTLEAWSWGSEAGCEGPGLGLGLQGWV